MYIRGDGADTVNDNGGLDTLEFRRRHRALDLDAERAGNDLILGLRDWAADGGAVAGQMSICRTPHRRAKVSRRDTSGLGPPCAARCSRIQKQIRFRPEQNASQY